MVPQRYRDLLQLNFAIPNAPLSARLRSETALAHHQLEDAVGFDLHHPTLAQATDLLERFFGVIAVLEPALTRQWPALMAGREKLGLLQADLARLGHAPQAIAALPRAHDAFELAITPAAAMGALYVSEGSTLGGKLISKALRRLPDWPISGPSYFDPYEERTGAMWNQFRTALDALPPGEHDGVIAGANSAFRFLHTWLVHVD